MISRYGAMDLRCKLSRGYMGHILSTVTATQFSVSLHACTANLTVKRETLKRKTE